VPILAENKNWYPPDWKIRSRFVRFSRAKNHCEWCNAENYKPNPVTGSKVILTTAHIHEGINRPHQLLNLAALCQLCHNRHDAKARARRRKSKSLPWQLLLEYSKEEG